MRDENQDNQLSRLNSKLLNVRWVAIVAVVFSVTVAIVEGLTGFIGLVDKFTPRMEYGYAYEVADEYYVLLARFGERKNADKLRLHLVELSKLSSKYEESPDTPIMRTSSILIGYEPDQVVVIPSDTSEGLWIVGLDVEEKQGGLKSSKQELDKIRNRLTNISMEFSYGEDPHELPQKTENLRHYFDNASIEYYSSAEFSRTYGVTISNLKKNAQQNN